MTSFHRSSPDFVRSVKILTGERNSPEIHQLKFFDPEILGGKNWGEKGSTNFLVQKISGVNKIFGVKKYLGSKKKFWRQKNWGQKHFGVKNNFVSRKF